MGDVKLAGVLGLYLGRAVAPGDLHRARSPASSSARRSSPARARPRAAAPRCRSGRSSPSAASSRLFVGRRDRRRVPRPLLSAQRRLDACPVKRRSGRSGLRGRPTDERDMPVAADPPASDSPHGKAHQEPRRPRHRPQRHHRRRGRASTAASASSAPPIAPARARASSATARSSTSTASPRRCARLFRDNKGLGKRVRVGVANQKIVVRVARAAADRATRKELDAAVRFQAQDQLPMPLDQAVIDYQPLDIVERPRAAPASASCSSRPAATWSTASSPRSAPPACGPRASTSPPSR